VDLTAHDRAVLDGRDGHAARKAMEILVALGRIFGAEDLVDVRSVQVSGVSFHNLGDAGLEWLEEMGRDGRVRAVTTLNPAGMDLRDWQAQGIDPGFAEKQLRVVRAYEAMGIATTCTCTPYLVGNLPVPGEHVAWAESSAVAFANSVLGARTNREGGPSALAAAITGRTPRYGLHLDDERLPRHTVEVPERLESTAEWGALGRVIGRRLGAVVPLLRLAQQPTLAELKSLCAAVVTHGGSPLFYVEGQGPAPATPPPAGNSLTVPRAELLSTLAEIADGAAEVDLVCLGCPHASLGELSDLADLFGDRRATVETWICTARPTADAARELGVTDRLEAAGVRVVCDTCFAVAPLDRDGATVATDSVKGCYYGRGHNKLRVHVGSVARCVEAAVTGRWS
jgi:predicted aconitase